MKLKNLALYVAILILAACKSPEEFREEDPVYHQMVEEAESRDSAMFELLKTINLIDEGISSISAKESELELHANDPEFAQNNRDRILNDIQEIYEMMEANKSKITELNRRLANARERMNKSDIELKHSKDLIQQYQLMIDNLNKKIESKDLEIAEMKDDLAKINISLDSLKTEYAEQTIDLNRVYYAFGTKKELLEKNVIDKSGGFIGIGKTFQLKSDFDRSFFTESSAEELTEIELYVKEATLITNHLDGSYHFESGDKIVNKIVIDDASKFWESSKFLVIQVEQ